MKQVIKQVTLQTQIVEVVEEKIVCSENGLIDGIITNCNLIKRGTVRQSSTASEARPLAV